MSEEERNIKLRLASPKKLFTPAVTAIIACRVGLGPPINNGGASSTLQRVL